MSFSKLDDTKVALYAIDVKRFATRNDGKVNTMTTETKALALRPNQAAAALGIGRDKLFDLLAAGEIKSFREGNTRLIPVRAIEEFLERRLAEDA